MANDSFELSGGLADWFSLIASPATRFSWYATYHLILDALAGPVTFPRDLTKNIVPADFTTLAEELAALPANINYEQLPYAFGVVIPQTHPFYATVHDLLQKYAGNGWEFLILKGWGLGLEPTQQLDALAFAACWAHNLRETTLFSMYLDFGTSMTLEQNVTDMGFYYVRMSPPAISECIKIVPEALQQLGNPLSPLWLDQTIVAALEAERPIIVLFQRQDRGHLMDFLPAKAHRIVQLRSRPAWADWLRFAQNYRVPLPSVPQGTASSNFSAVEARLRQWGKTRNLPIHFHNAQVVLFVFPPNRHSREVFNLLATYQGAHLRAVIKKRGMTLEPIAPPSCDTFLGSLLPSLSPHPNPCLVYVFYKHYKADLAAAVAKRQGLCLQLTSPPDTRQAPLALFDEIETYLQCKGNPNFNVK